MDRIEPDGRSTLQSRSQEAFPSLPEEVPEIQPVPQLRRRPRQPSIRLRRLSSASSIGQQETTEAAEPVAQSSSQTPEQSKDAQQANRRRSNSEPRPGRYSATPRGRASVLPASTSHPMYAVKEETGSLFRPSADLGNTERLEALRDVSPATALEHGDDVPARTQSATLAPPDNTHDWGMFRRASNVALSAIGRNRASTATATSSAQDKLARDEYDSRIVDLLDVIDPEVSTLSTLTNVQNSLFIPDLGGIINRTPTYTLTARRPSKISEGYDVTQKKTEGAVVEELAQPPEEPAQQVTSITSVLGEDKFAILPDGVTLQGWTEQDIEELNDHVRHMLHSRRSKFKRAMKGFGQYVRRPLGFLVTLYATLITLFGLAWVLFLIGWINVGGRQLYMINVIDNVLVALFAIMGDGLAPFRAIDTYHMIYIAHYHHLTWRLRKKCTLPKLQDKNDLPSNPPENAIDLERNGNEKGSFEYSILTPLQQQRLEYHQRKFSKSHTFYKPHETVTHYAFPLQMLVAIVVLLDCHSLFQIALGACTWGISYHVRPFALTTVILCCSITCNITGGVLISIGDRHTRKKEVVERISRQGLTCEAIKKVEKRKKREEVEQVRASMDVSEPKPNNV